MKPTKGLATICKRSGADARIHGLPETSFFLSHLGIHPIELSPCNPNPPKTMPINTANFDENENGDELSAYERAAQQERGRRAAASGQREVIDGHLAEVEEACALRRRRFHLRDRAERFEADPAYRRRVEAAKATLHSLAFLSAVCALLFFADLFLGTPDLAENLAHQAMSLIPDSWLGNIADTATNAADTQVAEETPKWLRLVIGTMLAGLALTLTLTTKRLGNEVPVRQAQRRLVPGDGQGWKQLQRRLWTCRAIKVGFLIVMAGLFCWLHSWAQWRGDFMNQIGNDPIEKIDLTKLGISLFPTENAATSEETSGESSATEESEKTGNRVALGAAATYSMLWVLHLLLILLPHPGSTTDLPLARFNPHRAEREAEVAGTREAALLRGIVARIQTTPREDNLRETLITLSEPVARAVNELFEREIMPLPAPEESAGSPFTFDTTAEVIPDEQASDPGPYDHTDRPDEDRARRFPEDDEDPGQVIFG